MKKPLVIYHANCTDGMAAVWVFKKAYGDTMEYHPGVYQMAVPDIVDRDVYMMDFSYPRHIMIDICKFARSVTVLDHHKTAIEDLAGLELDYPSFDMSHCDLDASGAYIAWRYVTQDCGVDLGLCPPFLLHVQDRDLWRFKLPGTKAIIKGANTERMSHPQMDYFMSLSPDDLKTVEAAGELLLSHERSMMESILSGCLREFHFKSLDGEVDRKLAVVNCFGGFFSDLGELFYTAHKEPIVMYYDTATHRVFGLRSQDPTGEDVGAIAKAFGGGGHKHAAGFKVDRGHYLAQL